MDNYILAGDEETKCPPPFPEDLVKDVLQFELKKHTKFNGIIARIEKEFKKDEIRRIMLFGIGECCAKCITCAEVLKSRAKQIPMILYQWNELRSSVSSDVWVAEDKRLDRIVVEKHIPKIFILMSRDPFPENLQCLSQQSSEEHFPSFLNRSKGAASSTGGDDARVRGSNNARNPAATSSRENKWKRAQKGAYKEKRKRAKADRESNKADNEGEET